MRLLKILVLVLVVCAAGALIGMRFGLIPAPAVLTPTPRETESPRPAPADTLPAALPDAQPDTQTPDAQPAAPGAAASVPAEAAAPGEPAAVDYLAAYAPVLADYRGYFNGGRDDADMESDYVESGDSGWYVIKYGTYDVSFLARYGAWIGYSLKDLNGDGVPELLFGTVPTDAEYPEASCIVDLFALVDGAPRRIAASSERIVYKLRSDDLIFYRGSGGAMNVTMALCRFDGAGLTKLREIAMLDGNCTVDGAPVDEATWQRTADEFESAAVDWPRRELG